MAKPTRDVHWNGSYVGRITEIEYARVVMVELQDDGTPYRGYADEDMIRDFDFRGRPQAIMDIEAGDFQVGDRVTVYVEFNNYTAVHMAHFDLDPRRLHNRLLRIEQRLGLETL